MTSYAPVFGQALNFFHYGLKDGISQQTIRCIEKDSRGLIWIGTQDGLNRFDGRSFKVFRHSANDTLAIKGKFINDILENSDGTIWVGTANHGVSYYDPNKDVFVRTSIQSGNCSSLSKDLEGNIYATFLDKSPVQFKKRESRYEAETLLKNTLYEENLSSSLVINSKLYLGTSTGSVIEVDLDQNELVKRHTFDKIGIIDEMLFIENHLLIGSSRGLYTLNSNNELSTIDLGTISNQSIENIVVEAITVVEDKLYVGTDNGFFVLNEFSVATPFKNVTHYIGDKANRNTITSNRVYDILVDDALIWIGTNNLDVASIQPPVFKTINTSSAPRLNNNYVFSIFRTPSYLFVGTRDGLNCIDTNGKVTLITKENTNQQLAFNVIRGMALDQQNNLWLATTKGVSVISLNNFNPEKPIISSIYNEPGNESSLSENKTRSIFVDHQNSIWITTYGGGLNRFTGHLEEKIYTFERYRNGPSKNSLSSNMVFHITQDDSDTYWITSENGLNKLQFENENYLNPNFERFVADSKDTKALQSNTTLQSYIDKNGTLWIATQNGLHKYDKTTNNFKHYNEQNGLSNTYVYAILEDQDQKLWVSTNDGLFRFDKQKELFTKFSLNDGVQSTEFNLGASFNDKESNTLYFGGINGFNAFNPSNISSLDAEGNLMFTELAINGKAINPIIASKNLKHAISKTQSITLSHLDFPCVLKFSDTDLRPRKSTSFDYKLNGTDWNPTNSTQEIQLLDLPKGKHILQVRGKSRDVIWNQEPLQLKITVVPSWYKSDLAYLFYLLSFLSLVYAFYRINLQHQIAGQESKRLQDLDDLKSRFITNITHEFRTPLTIILGFLDNLKEQFSEKEDINFSLETIEHNSHNLLDLVNQMLDLAKLEKGQLNLNLIQNDISAFTKHLLTSFKSIATDKGIDLKFNAEPIKIVMDYDSEKIRQILTNLISNAIKFSKQDSTVHIELTTLNTSMLQITIKDQGYGISAKALPFIFDRFYQVEHTGHKISQGTGVGLALTKELVECLNGYIEVDSKINGGTRFTILLPITNTATKTTINFDKSQFNIGTIVPQLENLSTDKDANSVLIVEDNNDMAHYIASCIKSDYNINFAKDGQEGLEMANQQIPDIIITDVMMPIMDGFELTQNLQDNSNTNHIPIIMLTAKGMQEDRLDGILSGADVYLTKPFHKKELQLRMQMLIAKQKKLQERYTVKTIVEQKEEQPKTSDKKLVFLNTVVNTIHEHLENVNFGPTELAECLAMSDSQLYRKLKALSNTSTAIFMRKVRLEKGKTLLKRTDLSVAEVAYAVGFNDPNWFSKTFKEEFNESPSEFRKQFIYNHF